MSDLVFITGPQAGRYHKLPDHTPYRWRADMRHIRTPPCGVLSTVFAEYQSEVTARERDLMPCMNCYRSGAK